ncbi:hypothetical protein SNE40_022923 [Patella caerulea]|uniref:Prokineticin domain-containing protein n=1 Tax=Patella caerulea TaxID=87958 RepID=A0AAN8G949_PATCE
MQLISANMYVLFVLLLGLQIVTCAVITNSQEQPCSMGAACSQSNSASYVNNVRYCCPNGNGISLSSSSGMYNNGQTYTTCTCHAERHCHEGDLCRNSSSVGYVNGVRYCCPNGGATSISSGYNNGQTYTRCMCHSLTAIASTGNFDWDAHNKKMQKFNRKLNRTLSQMNRQINQRMQQINRQLNREMQTMSSQLNNMFRGNPLYGR